MKRESKIPLKILVTGSRGKSSVVRLIHSALMANGLKAYGRITGVLPRELTPEGVVPIFRSSGGHVDEMKWWLSTLPSDAEAVVMENSAVFPDLQPLAAKWMEPGLTVITNIYPDHQEAWGADEEDAAAALCRGVSKYSEVVLGPSLKGKDFFMEMLISAGCTALHVTPSCEASGSFTETNISTALEACRVAGLSTERSEEAMRSVSADCGDFRVIQQNGSELAFAFSANDITSTISLFEMLHWDTEETILVFNHRKDRSRRLKAFKGWMLGKNWKGLYITGDRAVLPWTWKYFRGSSDMNELLGSIGKGKKIFGCGNIAGLPLKYVLERME